MGQYDNIIASAASAYGADPGVLYGIGKLESGFRPDAMNNWDSNAKKGTPSGGMFQFIQPTYSAFSRQAKAANPNAWKGVNDSWMDPQAQALTTAWAIKNGKGSHWATYGRAQKYKGKGPKATGPVTPQMAAPQEAAPAAAPQVDSTLAGILTKRGMNPLVAELLSQSDAPAKVQAPAAAKMPKYGSGKPTANSWRQLQKIAQSKFGLKNDPGNSQTTGGRHTAGSEHYSGRAIDFGNARNSQAQLNAWLAYAKAQGYDAINEGDHIHVSLPGSGI